MKNIIIIKAMADRKTNAFLEAGHEYQGADKTGGVNPDWMK